MSRRILLLVTINLDDDDNSTDERVRSEVTEALEFVLDFYPRITVQFDAEHEVEHNTGMTI